MNNPLLVPEYALPGTILTRREFEDCAEEARLLDDLLDRTDLSQYEFIEQAIERANARRTPQNLHLWVGSLHFRNVALVPAPLAGIVNTLRTAIYAQEATLLDLQKALNLTLEASF